MLPSVSTSPTSFWWVGSVVFAKLGDLEPLLQQVPLAFRDQLVDGDNDFPAIREATGLAGCR